MRVRSQKYCMCNIANLACRHATCSVTEWAGPGWSADQLITDQDKAQESSCACRKNRVMKDVFVDQNIHIM